MTYATAAPATSGGQGTNPPSCQNCTTSTTPLWRRDEGGNVLCNACGLFLKLHGRARPISLKTDIIKSRNRVKTSGPGAKKKAPGDTAILPAAHPDAPASHAAAIARRASQKFTSGGSERSNSPISRTGTPGLGHLSNIAPQHMFDGAALDPHNFHSPSLPSFNLRQPSPGSTSSVNGSHMEPPMDASSLYVANNNLKTRVSELEVINDLFRGRVAELENSEREVRRNLEEANAREMELKRRLEELEADLGPRHKKMRLSDIVGDSGASTPVSTRSPS